MDGRNYNMIHNFANITLIDSLLIYPLCEAP